MSADEAREGRKEPAIMANIFFKNYREAFMFLLYARSLGFTATQSKKAVIVTDVPCDDERWATLAEYLDD